MESTFASREGGLQRGELALLVGPSQAEEAARTTLLNSMLRACMRAAGESEEVVLSPNARLLHEKTYFLHLISYPV
jgi:hypothetical protein